MNFFHSLNSDWHDENSLQVSNFDECCDFSTSRNHKRESLTHISNDVP